MDQLPIEILKIVSNHLDKADLDNFRLSYRRILPLTKPSCLQIDIHLKTDCPRNVDGIFLQRDVTKFHIFQNITKLFIRSYSSDRRNNEFMLESLPTIIKICVKLLHLTIDCDATLRGDTFHRPYTYTKQISDLLPYVAKYLKDLRKLSITVHSQEMACPLRRLATIEKNINDLAMNGLTSLEMRVPGTSLDNILGLDLSELFIHITNGFSIPFPPTTNISYLKKLKSLTITGEMAWEGCLHDESCVEDLNRYNKMWDELRFHDIPLKKVEVPRQCFTAPFLHFLENSSTLTVLRITEGGCICPIEESDIDRFWKSAIKSICSKLEILELDVLFGYDALNISGDFEKLESLYIPIDICWGVKFWDFLKKHEDKKLSYVGCFLTKKYFIKPGEFNYTEQLLPKLLGWYPKVGSWFGILNYNREVFWSGRRGKENWEVQKI